MIFLRRCISLSRARRLCPDALHDMSPACLCERGVSQLPHVLQANAQSEIRIELSLGFTSSIIQIDLEKIK